MRFIVIFAILSFLAGCAGSPPKPMYAQSILEICTTGPEIYYPTKIGASPNMSHGLKRAAVLSALEEKESDSIFGKYLKGNWVFEEETADAVFVGYSVRSHYIKIAVIYQDRGVETIVCDSENMKQTEDSIHGKAPKWKRTFNGVLRERLAEAQRNKHSLVDAKANVSDENVSFSYNDRTNKGVLSVKGKSIQDRPWMLKKIAEVCASKNVALTVNKAPGGGRFLVLDESIKDGVFSIEFEVVY